MTFDWDNDKNELLKRSRAITFEQIVSAIEDGGVLDILEHPNPARYPGQRVYLVSHQGYVYVVPFVRDEQANVTFLKTIYPSRKYTRRYLRHEESNEE